MGLAWVAVGFTGGGGSFLRSNFGGDEVCHIIPCWCNRRPQFLFVDMAFWQWSMQERGRGRRSLFFAQNRQRHAFCVAFDLIIFFFLFFCYGQFRVKKEEILSQISRHEGFP